MPKLNFIPSRHGFHFANNFTNHVGAITTYGLCGGVGLASFNYYRHGIPVPTHRAESFGTPDGVPHEGSRLRDYIYSQQIGSLASAAGFFFPSWPWLSDADVLRDHYRASLGDFDRVCRAIDSGRFVLLGLRSSERGNLLGHQVLAYGYEPGRKCVWIYDSNFPDQEMMVEADASTERVIHKHGDGSPSADAARYASFFVQLELDPLRTDVFTGPSRPAYIDLGVTSGISLSAPVGDGLRQVGERLEVFAAIRNFGDYPAHVREILLWARDPRGANRDHDLGTRDHAATIAPGQEIHLHKVLDRFGEEPGTYRFGVSYLSEHGHWIDVPAMAPNTTNNVDVQVVSGADVAANHGTGGYQGPGTYFIRARHSGKVLDVNIDWFAGQNNGQPIGQFDLHGGDNQKFIVDPLPDGYVRILAKHSRKSIDVSGASTAAGSAMKQWEWHGGPNQQFRIEPIGDHYRIQARHSGMYFDIAGVSRNNGASLTQWTWWGGDNQLYQFVPTS